MFGIIRSTLLAFAIGCVIGFSSGFYVKHQFALAKLNGVITEQRKEDAHAVANMRAKEATLQAQLDETRARIESIQKEVKPNVIYRKPAVAKPVATVVPSATSAPDIPVCPDVADGADYFLDIDTVRMLDTARAGPTGPASWLDAEGEAAADISLTDFIYNDLEVVGMYHDLALRHDSLVDWVDDLINKQK